MRAVVIALLVGALSGCASVDLPGPRGGDIKLGPNSSATITPATADSPLVVEIQTRGLTTDLWLGLFCAAINIPTVGGQCDLLALVGNPAAPKPPD